MFGTLQTVLLAVVFIGGPFFLLWLIDRRKQKQGTLPQESVMQTIFRLVRILAVGIVVIVVVSYGLTWIIVNRPDLVDPIGTAVAIGFAILVMLKHVGKFFRK